MKILAIDPGNTESAWVLIDAETCQPLAFAKEANEDVRDRFELASFSPAVTAIEMVASYGMAVGADVFDTCVWIGRFQELLIRAGADPRLVKRHPVKMHLCHSAKANDSNITQALVDRFALGERNHGKGTKAQPGWFYGFSRDVWQAYALAVYAADTMMGREAA